MQAAPTNNKVQKEFITNVMTINAMPASKKLKLSFLPCE
jgi:hypothetical protein